MEHKFKNFIGIDVSKSTLDFSLCNRGVILAHSKVDNKPGTIKTLVSKLASRWDLSPEDTLVVVEYTGIYNTHLFAVMAGLGYEVSAMHGLEIKLSQGMARGKSDKVDSARIAMYGYNRRETIEPSVLPDEKLLIIKGLLSTRRHLVKQRKASVTRLEECRPFLAKEAWKLIAAAEMPVIKALEKAIKKVEAQVKELISQDKELKEMFDIVTSVPNIGPVTAVHFIVFTCGFKKIKTAREFASYVGVAPFPRQSGSSIRGKTGVSHMANKTIKSLLHMCAMTAISSDGEMKIFYNRKVAEGKHKMSVLNAIRNKLIHRVFACISQQRPYVKNYSPLNT